MKFYSIFVALLILLSPGIYGYNFKLICGAVAQASEVTEQQVAELYVATFNRAPDAAGLFFWVNNSGFTIEQIAESFFDQTETQSLYPLGTSETVFVTSVYGNLYNRAPDAAGLDYWVDALGSGAVTRPVMIEAVKNGAQGTDAEIVANKTEVGLYYASLGLEGGGFFLAGVTDDESTIEEAKKLIMSEVISEPINQTFLLSELGIDRMPNKYESNGYAVSPFYMEPVIRDIDNDGDSDVIIAFGSFAENYNDVITYFPIILENMGDGTLKKVEILNQWVKLINPSEIDFGDFNKDGRLDIVIAGGGYDGPDLTEQPEENIGEHNVLLMSNSDGTYTDSSELLAQERHFTHSVTVADINGDGWEDIYIGNMDNFVRILINNDGIEFNQIDLPTTIDPGGPSWEPGLPFTSSLFVDVDNDGVLELILGAVGSKFPGNSKIIDQDGQGNFLDDTVIELPEGLFGDTSITLDIDSTDLNGDGLVDLLLDQTSTTPYYGMRGLQILIQNTDGSFTDETSSRVVGLNMDDSYWFKNATFVDADKDGDKDILFTTLRGMGIDYDYSVVLYNDGNGIFKYSSDVGYPDKSPENWRGYVGYTGQYDKETGVYYAFQEDLFDHLVHDITGTETLTIFELNLVN